MTSMERQTKENWHQCAHAYADSAVSSKETVSDIGVLHHLSASGKYSLTC